MKSANLVCVLIVLAAASALAQGPAPAAPTPGSSAAVPVVTSAPAAEVGTPPPTTGPVASDPWEEHMKKYYDIHKFPKDQVIRLTATTGYPAKFMRIKMEIVGEDEEWVYLRNLPIEDPESSGHKSWKIRQVLEARDLGRQELAAGKFVMDPGVEHPLPGFADRVHFEEWSEGLPNQGRWQMGLAVADLNHDGLQDLVLPPPRLGIPRPWIVFQTATGWRQSEDVKWPDSKVDYGDVEVADFDLDGHLDIALACHFLRNYVFYGNGKGDFTRVAELPTVNPKLTSRGIALADFNGDGRQDIAALAELDIDISTNVAHRGALLQVLLNLPSGWKAEAVKGSEQNLYGDHVAAGDFDADGKPDIAVSSNKSSNRTLIFLNQGKGEGFLPVGSPEFPYLGYVFAVAAGDLDGKPGDEVLMGAFQNVRIERTSKAMNGVLVYGLSRKGEEVALTRQVVSIDGQDLNAYSTATVADLDGDGRNDLLLGRRNGGVEIYLQGLDGQFLREQTPELATGDAYINSLAVVEVGKKAGKKGDRVLVIEASDGTTTPGSVRALLVRPGPLTKPAAAR